MPSRETGHFVRKIFCHKKETAENFTFRSVSVFLGRHFLETLNLKQAGIYEKKLLYVRLCGVCVV